MQISYDKPSQSTCQGCVLHVPSAKRYFSVGLVRSRKAVIQRNLREFISLGNYTSVSNHFGIAVYIGYQIIFYQFAFVVPAFYQIISPVHAVQRFGQLLYGLRENDRGDWTTYQNCRWVSTGISTEWLVVWYSFNSEAKVV